MGRGIYWNTRPEDTVKAAKARAKAALNEKNPRLTALERAFYNALKNKMPSSFTFRVLGTPVPQGSVKAYGSRVVANNREALAVGALMLHLQHIVQGQTTGTISCSFTAL